MLLGSVPDLGSCRAYAGAATVPASRARVPTTSRATREAPRGGWPGPEAAEMEPKQVSVLPSSVRLPNVVNFGGRAATVAA